MRLWSAIILGLVGLGACLPTNPAPIPDTPANLTTDTPSDLTTDSTVASAWSKELEALAIFGLLHGLDFDVKDSLLEARGEEPPRERKVVEQMKKLPECFQTCFRNENGKVGVDIYGWDLNTFCYMPKRIQVDQWIAYNIYPCWKWQCRDHMNEIKGAGRKWMKETCP